MEELIVRAIPLPIHVRAFTIPDGEGDYNIYLNSNLTDEQQKKSLRHEKLHIVNGDFGSSEPASDIEKRLAVTL